MLDSSFFSMSVFILLTFSILSKMLQVNIIEVMSDAMYSDSEMIMDALSEFLDTLLQKQVEDETALESFAIAKSLMNSPTSHLDEFVDAGMEERLSILSELVSAVGLQRLRVNERLANGMSRIRTKLT